MGINDYQKPTKEEYPTKNHTRYNSSIIFPETNKLKFRKESELTLEQRTDPDYRIKQLEKLNIGKLLITCAKCHHCR
ncbi:MAG: hypothetical protein KKG60_03180 [Nanoarchaeota archaeon]|nr:hypothetical protein [Nanoarchaeota archaeon]